RLQPMRAREVDGIVELGVVCFDHVETAGGGKMIADLLKQQMMRLEFRVPLRGGHVVGSELVAAWQVRNDDIENLPRGNGLEHVTLQYRYAALQIRATDVFVSIGDGRL